MHGVGLCVYECAAGQVEEIRKCLHELIGAGSGLAVDEGDAGLLAAVAYEVGEVRDVCCLNGHGLSHFRHTDDDQVHVAVGFVGDDAVIVQRFVFLVAEAVEDQHFSGPVLIEVEGVEVYYGLVSWRYVGELEDIECSAVFH